MTKHSNFPFSHKWGVPILGSLPNSTAPASAGWEETALQSANAALWDGHTSESFWQPGFQWSTEDRRVGNLLLPKTTWGTDDAVFLLCERFQSSGRNLRCENWLNTRHKGPSSSLSSSLSSTLFFHFLLPLFLCSSSSSQSSSFLLPFFSSSFSSSSFSFSSSGFNSSFFSPSPSFPLILFLAFLLLLLPFLLIHLSLLPHPFPLIPPTLHHPLLPIMYHFFPPEPDNSPNKTSRLKFEKILAMLKW